MGALSKYIKSLGQVFWNQLIRLAWHYELIKAGLYVDQQQALPLIFNEINMEIDYRLDLLVEKNVVVEIKSIEALTNVHTAQVLTYLKLSNAKVSLLINFNVLKRFIARNL